MRKRTLEQSTYIMKEQMDDEHFSLHDLKQWIRRRETVLLRKSYSLDHA